MHFNKVAEIEFDGDTLHQEMASLLTRYMFPEGSDRASGGAFVSDEYAEEFHKRYKIALGKVIDVLCQQYAIGKMNDIVYPEEYLVEIIIQKIKQHEDGFKQSIYEQTMQIDPID